MKTGPQQELVYCLENGASFPSQERGLTGERRAIICSYTEEVLDCESVSAEE